MVAWVPLAVLAEGLRRGALPAFLPRPLPDDAVFVDAYLSEDRASLGLRYWSAEWPIVEPGAPTPRLEVCSDL